MATRGKGKKKGGVSITAQMLAKKRKQILKVWMKNQIENITLRLDLINREDLEKESESFFDALIKTISTGNLEDIEAPEYKPITKKLVDISTSRATQGFTPSETATYVFSLKDAILEFLQKEYADQPEIVNRETVVISKLLDKLGLLTFETYAKSRENLIGQQRDLMLEVSTPIMSLWRELLLLPVVGPIDSKRAQQIMEAMLKKISESEAKIVILDIMGVPGVDSAVANHIVKITKATRLMGCDAILSGISPEVAQTLVHLGISLEEVITKASLRDAIELAFEKLGYQAIELKAASKKR